MTSKSLGPDLDGRRARVAAGALTGDAVAELTPIVSALPMEALAPVKQLLKQFFSDQPWTEADDAALADAIGAGTGSDCRRLAPDLVLAWGWEGDRFWLRVLDDAPEDQPDG